MATKKEWTEYFRLLNDREPTAEEFEQAAKSGEFTEDVPKTVQETPNKVNVEEWREYFMLLNDREPTSEEVKAYLADRNASETPKASEKPVVNNAVKKEVVTPQNKPTTQSRPLSSYSSQNSYSQSSQMKPSTPASSGNKKLIGVVAAVFLLVVIIGIASSGGGNDDIPETAAPAPTPVVQEQAPASTPQQTPEPVQEQAMPTPPPVVEEPVEETPPPAVNQNLPPTQNWMTPETIFDMLADAEGSDLRMQRTLNQIAGQYLRFRVGGYEDGDYQKTTAYQGYAFKLIPEGFSRTILVKAISGTDKWLDLPNGKVIDVVFDADYFQGKEVMVSIETTIFNPENSLLTLYSTIVWVGE